MGTAFILVLFLFPFFPPQTPSNSVFGEKAVASLRNGHHAESWKSSKQQSLPERSEKIKVKLTNRNMPT